MGETLRDNFDARPLRGRYHTRLSPRLLLSRRSHGYLRPLTRAAVTVSGQRHIWPSSCAATVVGGHCAAGVTVDHCTPNLMCNYCAPIAQLLCYYCATIVRPLSCAALWGHSAVFVRPLCGRRHEAAHWSSNDLAVERRHVAYDSCHMNF